MNSLLIKTLLVAALAGFYLTMLAGAQTLNVSCQMNSDVGQAIGKMRTTQSNAEVLQVLSAIQDRKEQANQIILASISVLELEQRSEIITMLFKLPLADDGLSAAHIPLLIQLYVKAALCPHFSFELEQQRSFLKNDVLNSRLLYIIGGLLHAEFRMTHLPGEPMPRLLRLLESVRGSSTLPATVHKMIEDAIIVVKRGIEEDELKEKSATTPTTASRPSVVQELPTAVRLPGSSTTTPILSQSSSTIPVRYIIVLFMAALGPLWILLKRCK